ncbi:unnamed protein product, partial [Arabidopsis halleri]
CGSTFRQEVKSCQMRTRERIRWRQSPHPHPLGIEDHINAFSRLSLQRL